MTFEEAYPIAFREMKADCEEIIQESKSINEAANKLKAYWDIMLSPYINETRKEINN